MGGRARRGPRRRRDPRDIQDRILSAFLWVAVPVFALVMLGVAIRDAGPAYAAWRGHGLAGEFHGTERRCTETRHGTSCDELWGEFTSDDGTVEALVRHVEPPRGFGVGGRTAVRWPDRDRALVYRAEGSRDWLVMTAVGAAAVVTLVVWALLLARRQQRA